MAEREVSIKAPNGRTYHLRVPANATDEDAMRFLKSRLSTEGPMEHAHQAASGMNEGLADLAGFPVDMANSAVGLGMRGINAVFGTDLQPSERPIGGSDWIRDQFQAGNMLAEEPIDSSGQMVRRASQTVGASLLPAASVRRLSAALLPAISGGSAAAYAEQQGAHPLVEAGAELAGSIGPWGLLSAVRNTPVKRARREVPSTAALKEQHRAMFSRATAQGVGMPAQDARELQKEFVRILDREGQISNSGVISSDFPKVKDAFEELVELRRSGQGVKPQQMAHLRQRLEAATASKNELEADLALELLGQLDNWLANSHPDIKAASEIFQRYQNAKDMERHADQLAVIRAENSTSTDEARALEMEFERLRRNIANDRARHYPPELVKAIENAARGNRRLRAYNAIGQMGPKSGEEFFAGGTTSGPGYVGLMAGGLGHMLGADPMVTTGIGMGAGLATSSGAALARSLANKQRRNLAEIAVLTARQGGKLPGGIKLSREEWKELVALLAANAATQEAANAP